MPNVTSLLRLALVVLSVLGFPALADDASTPVRWERWSDDVFERATRERKLVLLDLEAVWCHWCHVMDGVTYRDPEVTRLLTEGYITLKVDQDSRPDLANRYEEYGWPATIVFDSRGSEIVKRSGFIPPGPMASLLKACLEDPSPGPSVRGEAAIEPPAQGALAADVRRVAEERHLSHYDRRRGGWGFSHKFLDADSTELALERARRGDSRSARMARQTLDGQRHLVDPVWGGVYQYSTGGVWTEPHFEKIVSMQADNLRIYSIAYSLWRDPRDLATARSIHRYLDTFLRGPEGAYYVSQDADVVRGEHAATYFSLDDAGRRAAGIPRVDTNVYARENGWVIQALTSLYAATGDPSALADAEAAMRWIVAHRRLADGGYGHGDAVEARYLGDTLSTGRAALALYAVTGLRDYWREAESAAAYLDRFHATPAGFRTSLGTIGGLTSRPQRDENMALARFANLLFRYSGKPAHRELAREAMRFVASPGVAGRLPTGGVLLADEELTREPLHVTMSGGRTDPTALSLYRAALAAPPVYRRIEWFDPREGPLPNLDVEFPELESPALFVCTAGRCSSPIDDPAEVRSRLQRLGGGAVSTPGSGSRAGRTRVNPPPAPVRRESRGGHRASGS